MVRRIFAIAVLLLLAAPSAFAKPSQQQCEKKGNKPQVFINPNTPIYRGPGLNYPVAGFIEKGRCTPFSEVSMDRQWILVDLGEKLGWVERGALATASQELVAKAGAGDGPIGSGQKRTFVEAVEKVMLMERPAQSGEPKSILPEGTRLLPLASSRSGKWIQVRDERSEIGWVKASSLKGEALKGLPITDDENAVAMGTSPIEGNDDPEPPKVVDESVEESAPPVPGGDGGFNIVAAAFGAALNPIHSLDSNSPNGYRTYDLTSFSGGAAVEVDLNDLGPIAIRLAYQFALVGGISPDSNPNLALSGFQHDAQLYIGLPLEVGSFLITPEIGYAFGLFSFDVGLPGTPAQFLSNQSHTGMAGARFEFFATRSVLLELDAAFQFGKNIEGPATLGNSGFTFGGLGGLGAQFLITDLISVIARYQANFRTTSYTGQASFDRTISAATLTDISHGLLLGVAFTIGI